MPLKIGFNGRVLADPDVRGWTRYTVELLKALSGFADLELVLFTREAPWAAHLEGIRARVVTFAAAREVVWEDWALPRMLRRERIDLFHAPADRGLPLRAPCPLVVTVHNSYERAHWRTLYPACKARLHYWKHELANWRADAVLAVSASLRRELIAARVAPAARLHAVHPAPAAVFRQPAHPGDESVLNRHEIMGPYLLYSGGYDRHKNVDRLVRAFDAADLPGWLLVVAARRRFEFERLRSAWQRLRCFARLRLVEPPPAELPALYRHAGLLVNPSTWESFSFPVVEAMAAGTPVLCSDLPALREVAGGAALFFDPNDGPALAALLECAARDAALRRRMRAAGLERARAFSWEAAGRKTVELYRQVLAPGSRPWAASLAPRERV
jgi:glycosyltransferase involved in cell wall biosynthesis